MANALDRTTSFLPLVVISVLLHVIGGTQASIAIEATERREGREAEVIGKTSIHPVLLHNWHYGS